ncbi:hypothetical protein ACPA9J_32365 [Pseudomonas aeruginosa]
MDEFDRRLLNCLQHGLPLELASLTRCLAAELDCREEDILRRLDDLLDDGTPDPLRSAVRYRAPSAVPSPWPP